MIECTTGLGGFIHNRDLLEEIAQQILEVEVIEGKNLQSLLTQSILPETTTANH